VLKSLTKKLALTLAQQLGRYEPLSASEVETKQCEAIGFTGEIPAGAGKEFNQYRLEFQLARPKINVIRGVVYTPRGMAWTCGRLIQKFSLHDPSIADVAKRPVVSFANQIKEATIIASETPNTYGDWVSEHLATLTQVLPSNQTLLVPSAMVSKGYVRRDLQELGIRYISVEKPLLIETAFVLQKRRPGHNWQSFEVSALRNAFKVRSVSPRLGSLLYLSRLGEKSEAQDRDYPSQFVGQIVEQLGGKVVFTRDTTAEEYRSMAREAETVIADHGGAMSNLLYWNTKNVIELFNDVWWTNCFVIMSKPLGVSNHVLLRVNAPKSLTSLGAQIIDQVLKFNRVE
jgi:hypothetical protein